MAIPINMVNASMWVPRVIEHAPLDGGLVPTNMEQNRQIFHEGLMAVSERMYAARDPVSNFGNETHIGNGKFSRISRELMEASVESIAKIMEKMGEYSQLGPMGIQEINDRSFEKQQQIAVNAQKFVANYGA